MPRLRLTLCPQVCNLDMWGINAHFSPVVDGPKIQSIWLRGLEYRLNGWSCGWRMSHSCGTGLITQFHLASSAPYLFHSLCPSLYSCSRRLCFLMQCCYVTLSLRVHFLEDPGEDIPCLIPILYNPLPSTASHVRSFIRSFIHSIHEPVS